MIVSDTSLVRRSPEDRTKVKHFHSKERRGTFRAQAHLRPRYAHERHLDFLFRANLGRAREDDLPDINKRSGPDNLRYIGGVIPSRPTTTTVACHLQILSLTLFEKLPLKQAVAGVEPIETNPAFYRQLNLFEF